MQGYIVDIWYSIWDNSYNSWGNDQGQEKECYSRIRNWKIGKKNDDVVSSYGMIKVIVRESEIKIFGTWVKVPLGWSLTTIEYSCLKQKAVGGGRELSFLRGQDSTYLSKRIRGVEKRSSRLAHNQKIAGSNPVTATISVEDRGWGGVAAY